MTLAAEPMTRKVYIVPPDLPLNAAWDLMSRKRVRHLPVVSGGALIGILSDRDVLVRATSEEDGVSVPNLPVVDVATPWPHVCKPNTDVRDLVRMMTEHKIDAVPVLDDADHLVGLVTSTDLLLLLIPLEEAKIPLPFVFTLEGYAGADAG